MERTDSLYLQEREEVDGNEGQEGDSSSDATTEETTAFRRKALERPPNAPRTTDQVQGELIAPAEIPEEKENAPMAHGGGMNDTY